MKKLLTLLCVIALLGSLCVPAFAAEDTVPVVAEVPSDWTAPNVYAWKGTGGPGNENAAWPGVPMTYVDGMYCAYIPADMENVIINNNGAQTADLPIDSGLPVFVSASNLGDVSVEPELPIEVPAADELANAPAGPAAPTGSDWYVAGEFNGWNQCDAAYKMEDDGDGTFSISFDVSAGIHELKVTNGTWDVSFGKDGGADNLVFEATADTVVTVEFDGVSAVTVSGDGIADSDGSVIATGSDWYVAGEFNSWNQCDAAYKMEDDGDGTFSLSFDVSAGIHELKVTNGTWDVSFGKDGGADNLVFEAAADTVVTVEFDGVSAVTVSGDGITLSDGSAVVEPTDPPALTFDVCYVAGSFNNWNQCDEAYKMTDNNDGTFTLTFALTAGTHEMKITNGTWDVSIGNGNDNYVFEVSADGNVTVNFDGAAIEVLSGGDASEETTEATDATTEATEATDAPTEATEATDAPTEATEATTAAPTETTAAAETSTEESSDNGLVIGIVVAVAAVVVGGVAIFFILRKKN